MGLASLSPLSVFNLYVTVWTVEPTLRKAREREKLVL